MDDSFLEPHKLSNLKSFLNYLDIRANKRLSQNFLIDANIIRKIIHTADLKPSDLVIEIGPGPGALTQELLQRGARVIAIEKDQTFATALDRLQTPDQNLKVFCADFLEFPLASVLKDYLKPGEKAKVVANLPYHITTPIISILAPLEHAISDLTLMVQKEMASRLTAQVGTSDYSSFTIFIEYFTDAQFCFNISPSCFYPIPTVHSAVVKFYLKNRFNLPINDFFKMTRTAFQKRRKMLRSSLGFLYQKERIHEALVSLGKSPEIRPEQLSITDFIFLFKALSI